MGRPEVKAVLVAGFNEQGRKSDGPLIPLQRPDKAARLTALGGVVGLWQMRDFSRRDQAIRT